MKLSEQYGEKGQVKCLLCPHGCILSAGKKGICRVRECDGTSVKLLSYGVISGFASDPVEKKPLYHFFPGYSVLSVGSYGCNLRCDFCQNDQISQHGIQQENYIIDATDLASRAAKSPGNIGLAYTYNEPAIWFEYVIDCASKIKEKGLYNVMITNGYVNKDPLKEYLNYIDAFNVDLKAFDEHFYHAFTGASLKFVMENLVAIAESGRHLEVTTLIIPGLNDSVEAMQKEAKWISENLGPDVPLHLSRYFPRFMRNDPPTPLETLRQLYDTASEHLRFVYTGNVSHNTCGSDTVCPDCGKILIRRFGYDIKNTGLNHQGRCSVCNARIISSGYVRL